MSAWTSTELSYGAWWSRVEPLLNAQGKQAYAATDPAQVPRLKILGPLTVIASTVETSTSVEVPTDQGTFTLRLSRPSGHSPWLVSRIYFPSDTP
ncbi:hypothetical protein [Pimelobacter sp. 30-1]|uniref:hypothetical protein n=1 Tax=Pimelobacter sp. 30-1 TaxID=2004991 RepID=UPI001C03A94C|nr:hypothetical protein [Pimelobacter sp. 30-1]